MPFYRTPLPHPLAQLSRDEFELARNVTVKSHEHDASLFFRSIYLDEPKREELTYFLAAEHAGDLSAVEARRPLRCAKIEYAVIRPDKHEHIGAIVDLVSGSIVSQEAEDHSSSMSYFTPTEVVLFQDACVKSQLWKDALAEFEILEGFIVSIDPWPYGGPEGDGDLPPRYMQGLVFAQDTSSKNPDSNHYGYPIPLIPVMDWVTKDIIRVDRLPTGGAGDGLTPEAHEHKDNTPKKKLFQNSMPADYVPELLDRPLRQDLKPLNVVQPEGASFTAYPDGLVEWQKWRFRLGFTPREGAVLHDVCYDGRSLIRRLSYSELTVPYGDPRPPFHRKQAFDFGDGGIGRGCNNLELGCDCLGAIHYMDSYLAAPDGSPTPAKAVVCLHEQDNGVLWKHTNFRTGRAVVARSRELVVQFIVTLANYEYIFMYRLDLAGGIDLETRATGILSVVSIDAGKTSEYGNVVAPGVLAQNHQHIFAARIDPAIDDAWGSSGETQIVVEESVSRSINPETNPMGNLYGIERRLVDRPTWVDAEPRLNRIVKLENSAKTNPISGRSVGYRLVPSPTQMLLADKRSTVAQRAQFAQHSVWVTGHRDGELWAAGELTNQSRAERGGVADMVRRGDWFSDEGRRRTQGVPETGEARRTTPVVWATFGLTHNPRVEDWPVMPIEAHQIHIRPADFFTSNPALDVPSSRNESSVLVSCCKSEDGKPSVQENPVSHKQGGGRDVKPRLYKARE